MKDFPSNIDRKFSKTLEIARTILLSANENMRIHLFRINLELKDIIIAIPVVDYPSQERKFMSRRFSLINPYIENVKKKVLK